MADFPAAEMDRVGEEFDGRFGIYVEELNSGTAENNVAAPREVADMLKKIHHGQMLSARSSEEMLGMLKDGRDRRMIPRYVKPEITIAHKYGSSGIIKGNIGIIYLPSGPLVVAGFALGRPGNNAELGSVAIARVTRLSAAVFSPESLLEEEEA